MIESLGKSQKLTITNHPIMYNKNKTWHACILVQVEMAWLQVRTVVSLCLERDMNRLILHVHKCHSKYGMKNCRHTGCNNPQHGMSGLHVSPSNRQPLAPFSVTDHLYIYQHMCSHSFVFITGLLHDLSSLIWTLFYVNHFMQFLHPFQNSNSKK